MSRLNSLLKMIFSNDTSVFIPESCVSDNPIRYERTRTPTNDHEYYHGTTRNDPDPATVEYDLGHAHNPARFTPTSLNGLNSS